MLSERLIVPVAQPSLTITLANADMKSSQLEINFADLWVSTTDIDLYAQYSYKPRLKVGVKYSKPYILDFAHPESKVAVEIQGGTWVNGRHSRGSGISGDYKKLNELQFDGWIVYQLSGEMITSYWVKVIKKTIIGRLNILRIEKQRD